ncbi:MAG: two-component system LytT family response regulator [Crocinitomix sp.]|jgi:two-component system LytT family response regulator
MIRSLIVDDVKANCKGLKILIEKYCPEIDEVIIETSPLAARTLLENEKIDLLFLDIEMPQMSGFELMESLSNINFDVIFVTAYNKYAIQAFKFEAIDYLMKPVSIEELQKAVKRTQNRIDKVNQQQMKEVLTFIKKSHNNNVISIVSKTMIDFVEINKLIRCEADGRYTKCFLTENREIYSSKNLKEYEIALADRGFLRVHHSHIVNLKHVHQFLKRNGGELKLSNQEIVPVSQRKREQLLEVLKTR